MKINASMFFRAAKKEKSKVKIRVEDLNFYYANRNEQPALHGISISVFEKCVTAIIGPSGCGKSTFLKVLNRMADLIEGGKVVGKVWIDGEDIYNSQSDVFLLRRKVGMVFQRPNLFPKSIMENVMYGLKIFGERNKATLNDVTEKTLRDVGLWNEVKDRLKDSAMSLSGGQQQRLCIARALAVEPEILLMDEPSSSLDPIAMKKIEELILNLKLKYTVILVTHNMQQAARVSDYTAFLYYGKLIEYNKTVKIFTSPNKQETEAYVTGRFG